MQNISFILYNYLQFKVSNSNLVVQLKANNMKQLTVTILIILLVTGIFGFIFSTTLACYCLFAAIPATFIYYIISVIEYCNNN